MFLELNKKTKGGSTEGTKLRNDSRFGFFPAFLFAFCLIPVRVNLAQVA